MCNREVQKNQKLEFELADSGFPLHYIMGVTTKNFRPIGQLEGLPLAPPFQDFDFKKRKLQNFKMAITLLF